MHFLNSFPFLSDDDRKSLAAQGVDDYDAVLGVDPATLAQVTGVGIGKIGKLRRAAESAIPAPAAFPINVNVSTPDPLTRQERIEKALRSVPPKYEVLRELGVTHVVMVTGVLAPDDTIQMYSALLSGGSMAGRVPATWRGKKVVALADAAGVVRYRNPRNGSELQGLGVTGVDEVTGEAWGSLGLDGLCVTKYGEGAGFFVGMTNEAVLSAMKLGPNGEKSALRGRVEQRMEALDVSIKSLETLVVVREREGEKAHVSGLPIKLGTDFAGNIADLFTSCFSATELRRFVAHGPDGERIANLLPEGTTSMSNLAYEAASILVRYGHHKHGLHERLLNALPRRARDVDAVFRAAGLL